MKHRYWQLCAIATAAHMISGCGRGLQPDYVPPAVTGSLSRIDGYATYVPGDSVVLDLRGTDDQGLAWLGYVLDGRGIRDSVPVSTKTAARQLRRVVPRAWIGTSALYGFVRDGANNFGRTFLDTIHVVDAQRRPMTNLSLPAAVLDVVADSARNVMYLSLPAAQRIAVLDLTTQQLRSPIELFGSPWGLDLTPTGDSLVVALRRTHYLAFVTLATGAVDTVRLAIDSQFSPGPGTLRVMQNRKIILAIAFDGSGYEHDGIREFDMSTGLERTRRDALTGGFSTPFLPLVRNSDRTRLIAVEQNSCCPTRGAVYTAATDTFAPQQLTVDPFFPAVSGDTKGALFLIDDVVFDSTLNLVVRLGPQTVDSLRNWATVISPDGQFAFIARDRAYKKVRIQGATDIERVLIPVTPYLMILPPRGDKLLAFTIDASSVSRLWIVDL